MKHDRDLSTSHFDHVAVMLRCTSSVVALESSQQIEVTCRVFCQPLPLAVKKMMIVYTTVFILCLHNALGLRLPKHLSFSSKRCLDSVRQSFGKSRLFATTTPTEEQKKSGLGWDSHQAIDEIPESLVKTIDGNDSMRRKFEALCRNAQVAYESNRFLKRRSDKIHYLLPAVVDLSMPGDPYRLTYRVSRYRPLHVSLFTTTDINLVQVCRSSSSQ